MKMPLQWFISKYAVLISILCWLFTFENWKTDVIFLEREIKVRKQQFGVEIYDLMESLEDDSELSMEEKEGRIRLSFDRARKDIAVIQAKIDCKKDEMNAIDAGDVGVTVSSIPPSSGHVLVDSHPGDR